jgi:pSer/pThr/pTyr-binding forkhead associated (FHA) protein
MHAPERTIGKLVLSVGSQLLREMVIDRRRLTIGRRSHSDLLLDDLTVSGEHAIIHTTSAGQSVIHDLKSRNGTLVNGVAVMQHPLADGDCVEVGIYRIVYRLERLGSGQLVKPRSTGATTSSPGPARTAPPSGAVDPNGSALGGLGPNGPGLGGLDPNGPAPGAGDGCGPAPGSRDRNGSVDEPAAPGASRHCSPDLAPSPAPGSAPTAANRPHPEVPPLNRFPLPMALPPRARSPSSGSPASGSPARPVPPALPPRRPSLLPAPVEPLGTTRASVRYLGGHDAGREQSIDRPIISIRNDIGQVAVIACRQGGHFLTHVEGLAYPLVNGESIGLGAHPLRDGDLIELAGTILQFSLGH